MAARTLKRLIGKRGSSQYGQAAHHGRHRLPQFPRRNVCLWSETERKKEIKNIHRDFLAFKLREIDQDEDPNAQIVIQKADERITCDIAGAIRERVRPGLILEPLKAISRRAAAGHFKRLEQSTNQAQSVAEKYRMTLARYKLSNITTSQRKFHRQPPVNFTLRSSGLEYMTDATFKDQKVVSVENHDLPEGRLAKERARKVLDWQLRYMPHVWPSVILQSMPRGTRMVLSPHNNDSQVQWTFSKWHSGSRDLFLRGQQLKVFQARDRPEGIDSA